MTMTMYYHVDYIIKKTVCLKSSGALTAAPPPKISWGPSSGCGGAQSQRFPWAPPGFWSQGPPGFPPAGTAARPEPNPSWGPSGSGSSGYCWVVDGLWNLTAGFAKPWSMMAVSVLTKVTILALALAVGEPLLLRGLAAQSDTYWPK